MNKYWKYELYPSFLEDVKDCTFVSIDPEMMLDMLSNMAKYAIQEFLFPKISLAFKYDAGIDPIDNTPFGEYFVEGGVGDKEFYVILAFMKASWIKTQITFARNFKNPFIDKNVSGFSPSALLKSMEAMYSTFLKDAERIRFNYNRITKDGEIAWGKINGKQRT